MRILSRDLKFLYENLPLGDSIPYSVQLQYWTRAQIDMKALKFWQDYLDGSQTSHVGDITQPTLTKSI